MWSIGIITPCSEVTSHSGLLSLLGYYFTGDGAYRDNDGDYQITGRVDDVINVKGHRLGTAELESAMVLLITSYNY